MNLPNNEKMFVCPICDRFLNEEKTYFTCLKCKNEYQNDNGFIDFTNKNDSTINDKILDELENYVSSIGFELGVQEFLKEYPNENKYLLKTKFDQSLDPIFHCINVNNKTCLIIGDRFGNLSEIASQIFESVYSINNIKSSLLFQKKRFETKNISNIKLVYSNLEKLPFRENVFDLILINENQIYRELNKYESNILSSKYFNCIKKILNSQGCMCLTLENKFGLKMSSKIKESNKKLNLKKYSLNEYLKQFKKLDYDVTTYWGYPSISRPYFSGEIEDEVALKWYFRNFTVFVNENTIKIKQKIIFKILKNIPNVFKKKIIKKFIPFFIFCCYKNEKNISIEKIIMNKFNIKNSLMISRRIKIIFIMFNQNGMPKKIIHIKRYGQKKNSDLQLLDSNSKDMLNYKNQIWFDDWKEGKPLDPINEKEVLLAIKWLIEFQQSTQQEKFKKEDIFEEINLIKNGIRNEKKLQDYKYEKWIIDYEKILDENQIKKTAIHGDFWYANMLYDDKKQKVNLVDWENYLEKGNPFHDIMTFVMRAMMLSNSNNVDSFKYNLTSNEKFLKMLEKIKKMLESHYKISIDFNILLKYQILRNTVKVVDKQSTAYRDYLHMLKILHTNGFFENVSHNTQKKDKN